jgi:putative tryptophan/tyrosine transport system substrate-binding protein
MRRRDFVTLLGGTGAALWPLAVVISALLASLAARAQQAAMPVIGFLGTGTAKTDVYRVEPFRQGLKEQGFVEGRNISIEFRWAESHYDRLPALADELVRRPLAVMFASGSEGALAAKGATATIPVVFETAADPVQLGLVASLNRPGGNLTGVTQIAEVIEPKRLQLLHELLPNAHVFGLLVNPTSPLRDGQVQQAQAAARTLGVEVEIVEASTESDFEPAFAKLRQAHAEGLMIGGDTFFTTHREALATLAAKNGMPASYQWREFVAAGGLMSYGASITDTHRLAGAYVGRILKGAKPADLPVQQATKIELYINLKTAKALGITVPLSLLGRADEVIE